MQIESIDTFLELARTRSFSQTAKVLFVSQSTVSTRIRVLEEILDRTLFVRSTRGGVGLTRAGEQFHRYAQRMSTMWQQAVQEVGLPDGYRTVFSLGTQVSLWEPLVLNWIPWMREHAGDVALQVDAAGPGDLTQALSGGTIDVAVMYEPEGNAGLIIERLVEESLVLVSTRARAPEGGWVEDYVYVDWGEEFRAQHADAFPGIDMPSITLNLGDLALRHVLSNGGSGYFPLRQAGPHLEARRLVRIPKAPVFRRSVFVAFSAERKEDPTMKIALRGLKACSKASRSGS